MPVDLGLAPGGGGFVGSQNESVLTLLGPVTGLLTPALR
jgi:hypothetical protein